MSEPDRDKLTEALFQAARDERASEAVKARVLDELLATPPPSSGTGAVATRKWAAWAGLALLAAVGLVVVTRESPAAEPEPMATTATGQPASDEPAPRARDDGPEAVVRAEVPEPPATPPPGVGGTTAPGPSPEAAPSASPKEAPAPRLAPRRPAVDATDRLAREVRLVDEARRRLASSPTDALRVLDAYTREFGAGALHTEASLVRLEALVKAGRQDEARRLAKRLVAGEPGGAIAARVRELLEEAQP